MPKLILTDLAMSRIESYADNLLLMSGRVAVSERFEVVLRDYLNKLRDAPHIGRVYSIDKRYRELVVPFGGSNYLLLYRFVAEQDCVYIANIRHGRQSGYTR